MELTVCSLIVDVGLWPCWLGPSARKRQHLGLAVSDRRASRVAGVWGALQRFHQRGRENSQPPATATNAAACCSLFVGLARAQRDNPDAQAAAAEGLSATSARTGIFLSSGSSSMCSAVPSPYPKRSHQPRRRVRPRPLPAAGGRRPEHPPENQAGFPTAPTIPRALAIVRQHDEVNEIVHRSSEHSRLIYEKSKNGRIFVRQISGLQRWGGNARIY